MQPSSSGGRAGATAPTFDVMPGTNGRPARTRFARPPVPAERQQAAPVLLAQSVTKRWPRQPHPVLRDISFELRPAELGWLTGVNGAGKTTLLRIIAGLLTPDAGRVDVCGLGPGASRREYQRAIGLLSAGSSGLYARMTVRQHLDYWARLALVAPSERRERVDECIERFTLASLAGRRTDRMSMGQRQRLRIAMAFVHRPRLVLLDEPTTSLDDEGCGVLLGAIDEHRRAGGAVLWCSPAREQVGTSVDRSFRLAEGELSPDA